MKIITIQATKESTGYVASVNGFQGATGVGKDEISALRRLVSKLEATNSKFIQKSDWDVQSLVERIDELTSQNESMEKGEKILEVMALYERLRRNKKK